MARLDWLTLWDAFRERIQQKTSWGKVELTTLMDEMERQLVREIEASMEKDHKDSSI